MFEVFIDDTHKEHKISDKALRVIINDLENPINPALTLALPSHQSKSIQITFIGEDDKQL